MKVLYILLSSTLLLSCSELPDNSNRVEVDECFRTILDGRTSGNIFKLLRVIHDKIVFMYVSKGDYRYHTVDTFNVDNIFFHPIKETCPIGE